MGTLRTLQVIADLSYRYSDEESSLETVEALVDEMAPHRNIPAHRLLDGTERLGDFDGVTVQQLLCEYLTPENCRVDIVSSSYATELNKGNVSCPTFCEGEDRFVTDPLLVGESPADGSFVPTDDAPQVDPMFGTQYWCHPLPQEWLDHWRNALEGSNDDLHLPPRNPFVPVCLDLASLPDGDSTHRLLYKRLKVQLAQQREWYPATFVRYDKSRNRFLVVFEDGDESWHLLDSASSTTDNGGSEIYPLQGTMDGRAIKFRVVGPDDSAAFPSIPPPSRHTPIQIANSHTLKLWWLQDRIFLRPIVSLRLEIICRAANSSALHRAVADLIQAFVTDSLVETSYLAEMCMLTSSVCATDIGFEICLEGFDQKLPLLAKATLTALLSFRGCGERLPDQFLGDRFLSCLETLQRNYKNSNMESSSLVSKARLLCLRASAYSANQRTAP